MLGRDGVRWTVNFAERPSKLFSGVEKRLTIWITKQELDKVKSKYRNSRKALHTSRTGHCSWIRSGC
jgi:hypothetical protein